MSHLGLPCEYVVKTNRKTRELELCGREYGVPHKVSGSIGEITMILCQMHRNQLQGEHLDWKIVRVNP